MSRPKHRGLVPGRRKESEDLETHLENYRDAFNDIAMTFDLTSLGVLFPGPSPTVYAGQRLNRPREWRNGRRAGLRIRCPKGRGGSTPPSRTY